VDILTREEFIKILREGLNHLQAPDALRRSPLAALFGVADRFDTFSALQRILIEAIESLEPDPDEPPQSRAWRIYESLFYRYIQQLNQQEVAEQLGLGARQVRREQRAALEALADLLWEQFDLQTELSKDTDKAATLAQSIVNEELAWLRATPPAESADLAQVLSDLLDLIQPLAERHRVGLETRMGCSLPKLAVHPVALNQILLNVLGVAFHAASGSQVSISARHADWKVEIQVCGTRVPSSHHSISDSDAASLEMAHRLASLCKGKLILSQDEGAFSATLLLPALQQWSVLVIDDNADALRLLERYAAGTRYRLVGTREPEQALSLAEELSPQIIVLDVMMPQIDGWKVLRRLRQHPLTSHIPVVVCTILAQEELAFTLGANDFVHKPVTRQGFLTALDRQVEQMETGSR
jgi:CheY-like chemotaxis protein